MRNNYSFSITSWSIGLEKEIKTQKTSKTSTEKWIIYLFKIHWESCNYIRFKYFEMNTSLDGIRIGWSLMEKEYAGSYFVLYIYILMVSSLFDNYFKAQYIFCPYFDGKSWQTGIYFFYSLLFLIVLACNPILI